MLTGDLLAGVEHPRHVHRRLGDTARQFEHDGQAALHVRRSQPPQDVAVDAGTLPVPSLGPRDGVSVAGEDQSVRPTESGPGDEVVANPIDGQARHGTQAGLQVRHKGGLVEADRRNVDQFGGEGEEVRHGVPARRIESLRW